jgi:hypothetical protein
MKNSTKNLEIAQLISIFAAIIPTMLLVRSAHFGGFSIFKWVMINS